MRIFFFLFLFSVPFAHACGPKGNNGKGSGNGNTGGGGNEDVLTHKTGGLKDFGSVPPKDDDIVAGSPDDLACSSREFRTGCCWRDRKSAGSEPTVEFRALSGKASASAMQDHFDDFSEVPAGPGVIGAYTNDPLSRGDFAALESCVVCLSSPDPITISLQHWATPGTTLEACVTPADSFDPTNCQSVETGKQSVTIQPLTDPFRIVLRAGTFLDETGSIVMMDDLKVQSSAQFTDCMETPTTTTEIITEPTIQPLDCGAINCDFDSGTPCNYQTSGTGGSQGWIVTDQPIGNLNTGVRRPPPDSPPFYAGTVVPKGGKAVMKSGYLGADRPTYVRFEAFEATENIALKACIDGETNCCWQSNEGVSRQDLVWTTQECAFSAGSGELWFVAENSGNQHGSCGIDNIQLLDANGSPAC